MPAAPVTKAAMPCARRSCKRGRRSPTRTGATAGTSSPATAECPNGRSRAPRPTGRASSPTAAPCSRSATARSPSRTHFARRARRFRRRADHATSARPIMKQEAPPARYDPRYDPLVAPDPGCNQDYPPSYWAASAGPPPPDDGPITGDRDVDVAIIGAGYTGLATAIFLAREHGIRATVLEANRTGWGCSGRNGGQGQFASGRLTRAQWVARWGLDTARRMHAEIAAGFK